MLSATIFLGALSINLRYYLIDSSVKSLDHLTDNCNWPFKIANKVTVNVFS